MRKKVQNFLRILPLAMLFFPVAQAKTDREIHCKVVGVSDGDTLTCLANRTQLKVRLQYIDAPEKAQAFGNRAKQTLASLVFKKDIRLISTGYDKYDRILAVVYDDQANINLTLVQKGMAWAYRQTQPIYQQAQAEAQWNRIGLWQDANPINPADWRAKQSESSTPFWQKIFPKRPLATSASTPINCSVKKSCNQISDYEQAQRYFQQCRWQELDGNNDGIPCNRLYRKAQQQK